MTERTQTVFEKYEVRKTKAQKSAFIDFAINEAEKNGYEAKVESAKSGARNIVIGNPDNAEILFTAHYDTCPVMPFPNLITPKNIFVYILYQLLIVAIMLAVPMTLMLLLTHFDYPMVGYWTFLITYFGSFLIMMYGPANKHTANDNTSGVITVLDIMADMPEQLRDKAAFILFDLEEQGLIGSSSYRKAHKEMTENKIVVNFDCVSDGKNILIVGKKKTKHLAAKFEEAFRSDANFTVEYADKGVLYPSDQHNFPLGVGIAALQKTNGGLLYMDKIHTKNDTVFDEENIAFLKSGAIKLTEIISSNE